MNSNSIFEVVSKLVGKVRPIGESNEDEERYHNLKVMCELAEYLLDEIEYISRSYSDRSEFSAYKAGQHAKVFLINNQIKK